MQMNNFSQNFKIMKNPFQVKKILIPIDFSATSKLALEHAANLCKKFNSELHLIHIFKNTSADVLPNISATDAYSNSTEGLKTLVANELNSIGEKFSSKYNVGYNVEIREGSVSKEITKAATEVKADMIVMGTHGVSGVEEFFMGSNAYRVVTTSPLPVLTVQGHADLTGYENIVLPIDSSQHTRDKVSQAVTFAEAYGSTIHILGLVKDEEDEQQEEKEINLKIKQVKELLSNKDIKFTFKKIEGNNIAESTLKYSESVDADLTIIMTDQENYTGFFVGPYAQRIVNHSKTPVLTCTPIGHVEGFTQRMLGGDYRPFYV